MSLQIHGEYISILDAHGVIKNSLPSIIKSLEIISWSESVQSKVVAERIMPEGCVLNTIGDWHPFPEKSSSNLFVQTYWTQSFVTRENWSQIHSQIIPASKHGAAPVLRTACPPICHCPRRWPILCRQVEQRLSKTWPSADQGQNKNRKISMG